MRQVRAPGKLFLFGEYGVLAGGWAVLAAVDRHVIIGHDASHTAYSVRGASFVADTALPEAALRAASLDPRQVDHLQADLSELYDASGKKLGFGSSAASTIAALAAAEPALLDQRDELFSFAFQAHREIQNGRGSGADVAASVWGGTLAYRLTSPQPPFAAIASAPLHADTLRALPDAEILPSLTLPEGLRVEAIWTGDPASSTELVGRVEATYARQPEQVAAIFSRLSGCATTAIEALRSPDALSRWLDAARTSNALLHELSALTGAPIITPRHEALEQLAASHNLVAKSSGAGGGDFSLLFGPRDADWAAARAALPEGCRHEPLHFGAPGATLV